MKTAFLMLTIAALTLPQTWAKDTVDPRSETQAHDPIKVELKVNRSTVIDLKPGFRRVSITTGEIAEAVAVSPTELLINGKSAGDTSLIIWDKTGARTMYNVHVAPDDTAVDLVRAQLAQEVGTGVTLSIEGQYVFLRGTVPDLNTATRAESVAAALGKVVNLLRVKVPQGDPQILLKVRFASLDRSLSEQLGINLFALNGLAKGVASTTTGQFGTPPSFSSQGAQATASYTSLLNMFYLRPDIGLAAAIQDLEAKNVLQILAEPNVLALSGHEASFLAGGEFPFPTIQGGASGVGQITIQFREFGIRLKFLPTITPRGTIHLVVKPEVSSLDYANGLSFNGITVPGLSTRRVETQVELQNGQSFAIAGLLDDQATQTFDRMPGISSVPILGKFFQSRQIQKSKGELLVLITPEIVSPIPAGGTGPDLKRPIEFMQGSSVPADWENAADPKSVELQKQDTLPVEELNAITKAGDTDPGEASPGAAVPLPIPVAPAVPAPTHSN